MDGEALTAAEGVPDNDQAMRVIGDARGGEQREGLRRDLPERPPEGTRITVRQDWASQKVECDCWGWTCFRSICRAQDVDKSMGFCGPFVYSDV